MMAYYGASSCKSEILADKKTSAQNPRHSRSVALGPLRNTEELGEWENVLILSRSL